MYKININDKDIFSSINPYEIIGINEINQIIIDDHIYYTCYKNFKDKPNEKKMLSYYILYNESKFNRKNNNFNIKNKDHFYYVIINDLINLKKLYEKNKYIIAQKDKYNFSLLHYSVIGGYYEMTKFLLRKGINYDEPNKGYRPKTALYYAEGKIKNLLTKYGARITMYNCCNGYFQGIIIQN